MKTIKLMIGKHKTLLQNLRNQKFPPLIWMSDNLETVAHYYEGCVIEVEIRLDMDLKSAYVASETELSCPLAQYGWGSEKMEYPEDATWFSFSDWYLKKYMISVREIFPCLLPFVLPPVEELEELFRQVSTHELSEEEGAARLKMTVEEFRETKAEYL